jgi:hypothetical protein
MPHRSASAQPEAATLIRLSDELTTALRGVIDSSRLRGLGPMEIARTLGIDKTLTSRLLTALRAPDPLAALGSLPGAVPLRQFVRAAREHGASARAVRAADRELLAFDQELQRTFGTRTRLDAALADALPDARRRQQESARQAVHRGLSLIKGVSIDLASVTWLILPSPDHPDRADVIVLAAFLGVHRLRPSARVRFGASHARSRPSATLLSEYCQPRGLAISTTREHDLTFYEIASGPIGRDAAADVYFTDLLPGAVPRASAIEGGSPCTFGEAIAHPYKRLALNILIHDEVWPRCDFGLRAYDTALRGMVRVPDASRDADLLPLDASAVRSRATPDVVQSSPIPRFAELLQHVAAARGWDPVGAAPRLFRVELLYPLYGTQIMLVAT